VNVTNKEMALMLALSELHDKALVVFVPVGKEYTHMLKNFRTKKYVEPHPKTFGRWVLSDKGRQKFLQEIVNTSKYKARAEEKMKVLNEFISNL
jgi:hypothetical protein